MCIRKSEVMEEKVFRYARLVDEARAIVAKAKKLPYVTYANFYNAGSRRRIMICVDGLTPEREKEINEL